MRLSVYNVKKLLLSILFLFLTGSACAATLSVAMTEPVRPGPISGVMGGGLSGLSASWTDGNPIGAVSPYINGTGVFTWWGAFLNSDGTAFPAPTGYKISCGTQTYIADASAVQYGYGTITVQQTRFADGDYSCTITALSNTLTSAPSNEAHFKLAVSSPAPPSYLTIH